LPFVSFGKYKTEFIAGIAAIIMILSGLFIPTLIPDKFPNAPPGFQDTTWLKLLITCLFIGMGVLFFTWLVVIQKFIVRSNKSDLLY
jgi:hypothetical protein